MTSYKRLTISVSLEVGSAEELQYVIGRIDKIRQVLSVPTKDEAALLWESES
jgi:hypothetical protein